MHEGVCDVCGRVRYLVVNGLCEECAREAGYRCFSPIDDLDLRIWARDEEEARWELAEEYGLDPNADLVEEC